MSKCDTCSFGCVIKNDRDGDIDYHDLDYYDQNDIRCILGLREINRDDINYLMMDAKQKFHTCNSHQFGDNCIVSRKDTSFDVVQSSEDEFVKVILGLFVKNRCYYFSNNPVKEFLKSISETNLDAGMKLNQIEMDEEMIENYFETESVVQSQDVYVGSSMDSAFRKAFLKS